MSKLLKSILVASLVACMTVCLGLFAAACNNTPEDTDKYFTVTVVLPDGNKTPVKDAEVAICTMNGSILTCLDGVKTDENGVAKSNITSPVDYSDTTKFLVKIHDLPDGYIYADEDGNAYGSDEGVIVDTAVSGFSVTITLTEKPLHPLLRFRLTLLLLLQRLAAQSSPQAKQAPIFSPFLTSKKAGRSAKIHKAKILQSWK